MIRSFIFIGKDPEENDWLHYKAEDIDKAIEMVKKNEGEQILQDIKFCLELPYCETGEIIEHEIFNEEEG